MKPVQEGLRKVRSGVAYIRQEGVVRNGSEKVRHLDGNGRTCYRVLKVKLLEDSSFLDFIAMVLALDFFFALFGIKVLSFAPACASATRNFSAGTWNQAGIFGEVG